MKIVILILLFINSIFANTIELSENSQTQNTKEFAKVFVDKEKKFSFEEVQADKKILFKESNQSQFSYSNSNIWVNFSLKNISTKANSYVLINTLFFINEIDFHTIKSGKLNVEYLGKERKQSLRKTLTRYHQINLTLMPNEEIEVFIRFSSLSAIDTNFKIFTNSNFMEFYSIDSKIWGLIIGVLLTLIIYNSMMFVSLKDKSFLYYVLHALITLINITIFEGILYELHFPRGDFIYYLIKIIPNIGIVFLILFTIYFFNLKKYMPIIYKINIFLIAFFSTFAFAIVLFNNNLLLYNKLMSLFSMLFLIYILFLAFMSLYKKLFGSIYFFLGIGIYSLFFIFQILYITSMLEENFITPYLVPIGIVFDMFFLSMALGQRVALIEKKRMDNEILLNEHSKFITMGQILAGIIHQLRQPIVYIGTNLLKLEAMQFQKGENIEELKVIEKIKNVTKSMDKTIFDFYDFYAKEKSKSNFNIYKVIDDVISILSTTILKDNTQIINRVENLKIDSYQNSLSHILMIIIENAVDIAKERKIKNPKVEIYSKKLNSQIEIYIKDNCGGVKQKPIDSIFEPTISEKKKNSMGIGLTMAKSLVEKKLNGNIEVKNIEGGAEFKIVIKL